MAQMPVAVVGEVSSSSGMWPWWTVTAPCSARRTESTNARAEVVTPPPSSLTSMSTGSVKTSTRPSQSLVSNRRK